MTQSQTLFRVISICGAVVLAIALASVEFRSRNPEWEAYQRKGVELSIQELERKAASARSEGDKKHIQEEMVSLSLRELSIIEVRPFGGKMAVERCLTCHYGVEDLSASHPNSVFGCVICHGGNGPDLTVRGAHRGLRGCANPARLDLASASCGGNRVVSGCHAGREDPILNRVENVPRALMATNAGIITILRFQWGLGDLSGPRFGIRAVTDGRTRLRPVPPEISPDGEFNIPSSHFRKFCAACHLWTPLHREKMGRLDGCAACHAPFADDGRYHGCDPTINREEIGHAATHSMTNRIPDERCRRCHNRSARVGLNYHGEMESAQYGTPFVRGDLNDDRLGDNRFVLRLVPDIHHEQGMGCIDCHTGQDTMGDGTLYAQMEDQIEIRCEDCHGSYSTPPKSLQVPRFDPLVQTLIRSAPFLKTGEGDEILLTSRGRPLPHVRKTAKGYLLTSKITGKDHPVTVITGKKKAHAIVGHTRLECDTCHSAWSPQCYGCHQFLDFGHKGLDHLSKKRTQGRWAEGRSYFRFSRNIYGINSRGRVGILIPGCQVWNTVVDSKGAVVGGYDSRIMKLKNGLSSIAVGPTHPHTTRTEVPRCVDCHLDAKAIGLGEGRIRLHSADGSVQVTPVYDSRSAGLDIDYPLEAVVDAAGKPLQSTSHQLARPFNSEEIRKITAIAPCLPCHDRYDDPVWQRPGPYVMKEPCRQAVSVHGNHGAAQ